MRSDALGDLGRPDSPTMVAPARMRHADYLLLESTYGDRTHDRADPLRALAEVINRTARRGGTVLVPAFAVGRAQTLLYYVRELKMRQLIPNLPVYLDSPMAIDASRIFCAHVGEHRLGEQQCRELSAVAEYIADVEASKALDRSAMPRMILSASGMATGGRVLHHLKALAPDRRNTVLFAGFQAPSTRGAAMVAGAESIKIHGAYVPVAAEVQNLGMLSAHADREEILAWLDGFEAPPRMTFIVHGEPAAADCLRHQIEERLAWSCRVPDYLQRFALGAALGRTGCEPDRRILG